MQNTNRPGCEGARRRGAALLFVAGCAAYGYNNVFMTLAPAFVQSMGGSVEQAGLQGTVYLAMAVLLRFAFGPLADRRGTKPVMLAGLAAFVASAPLFCLCTAWWHVLLVRCVQSVGIAAFFPCATAYVAAVAPPAKTGTYLGLYRLATASSLIVGPAAAFALVQAMGYAACFAILTAAACLAAAAVALAPSQRPDKGMRRGQDPGGKTSCAASTANGRSNRAAGGKRASEPRSRRGGALRRALTGNPRLAGAALGATLLGGLAYGLLFNFAGILAQTSGPLANPGSYFACVGMGSVVANPLIGWASDRIDRRALLAGCLVCCGCGMALLGAQGLGAVAWAASGILAGAGYAGAVTAAQALISSEGDRELAASLMALQQNAIDLGIAFSGVLFGGIFGAAGMTGGVFAVWGGVTAAAGALIARSKARPPKERRPAKAHRP